MKQAPDLHASPWSKKGITKEAIVLRAIELLDSAGWEQFSLRRLALKLDLHVTSLYQYFPTKESLLTAVWQRLQADVVRVADETADWKQCLRTSITSLAQVITRHPWSLNLGTYAVRDLALSHMEIELARLGQAGFSPQESALAVNAVKTFAIGSAIAEVQQRKQQGSSGGIVGRDEDFPHVVAAASFLGDNAEQVFSFGLDSLLDAIDLRHREGRLAP